MERFGPGSKFSVQSGPPPEVVLDGTNLNCIKQDNNITLGEG